MVYNYSWRVYYIAAAYSNVNGHETFFFLLSDWCLSNYCPWTRIKRVPFSPLMVCPIAGYIVGIISLRSSGSMSLLKITKKRTLIQKSPMLFVYERVLRITEPYITHPHAHLRPPSTHTQEDGCNFTRLCRARDTLTFVCLSNFFSFSLSFRNFFFFLWFDNIF